MSLPRKRRYSLRVSLMVLVAVCVVPAAAVSGWLVYSHYEAQRTQIYSSTLLMAREIAADVDRELAAIEAGLRVLATSGDLAEGNLAAFHRLATDALEARLVYNYILSDREGGQLLNTLLPYGGALSTNKMPAPLPAVFETGVPALSDLVVCPMRQQPVLVMAVPVKIGEHVRYGLNAGLAPERLSKRFESRALPPGWVVAMLDGNGLIAARSQNAESFIGQKATAPLVERLRSSHEGTLEALTKEGVPTYVAFSRSSAWSWSIAVGAPKAALNVVLYRQIGFAVAATALALVVGLWLARRVANRVLSAVCDLNEAARALGKGKTVELPDVQLVEAEAVGDAIVQASHVMAQVSHRASHDILTGLANRALFDELLHRHLARLKRRPGGLAVLAIDLDGFKAVNDQQGHAMGDLVLQKVAKRIAGCIRTSDIAARMGGDEFSVLLGDADRDIAMQTAQRLVALLAEPYPGARSPISASIGVAVYPFSGITADDLLGSADRALYAAKGAGKHCAVIAPDMNEAGD
ncbi:sensor domain-containing diguanylate cyclase [Propionivibrio limicola]|uniref:sensor domain-containing diguanylate cyclase n=1 Tax=Propionivibrio limicola TaxID=167645 RepID=UPI00129227DD|nr:sensor domain-containing diguanylate cyclase [Propionivibrio limicola]